MNTTIDKKEIDFFSNLSKEWWEKDGSLRFLHKLTDVRIEFILRSVERIKSDFDLLPLKNFNCIDIGCGGGILSERLKRLGADVTAIDVSEKAISIAKLHAELSRLNINYECMSTSDYISKFSEKKFDVVIASEVIEHVIERKKFLCELSHLSNKGGLIIITTINKSLMSVLFAKYFSENILKILPKGTHDINKFVSPEDLIQEAKKVGIILDDLVGFTPIISLNPFNQHRISGFKISNNSMINYGLAGLKVN